MTQLRIMSHRRPSTIRRQARRNALRAVIVVAGVALAVASTRAKRGGVVYRQRLQWDRHSEILLLENEFKQYYRMSATSFEKLLGLIAPMLARDSARSQCRTGTAPITPTNMLQMTISWLAGGSYHQVRVVSGVARSTFYSIIYEVMDAINDVTALKITTPFHSDRAIQRTAQDFSEISTSGILTGCVGCVDGWLCTISSPPSTAVPDVRAFFSGHYQESGINVQAMCDSFSRFTCYCIKSPGKVNDVTAFNKWKLSVLIDKLPLGYYVIGDNAYTLSQHLLVPFTKPELKNSQHAKARNDYNFFLSQLRIRIEMAFGLLVNKWRVFKRPLSVKFANCSKIITTCMHLHNFCINERLMQVDQVARREAIVNDYNALPECSYPLPPASNDENRVANGHLMRELLVQQIKNYNLARPPASK